jgi:hypothetical protein
MSQRKVFRSGAWKHAVAGACLLFGAAAPGGAAVASAGAGLAPRDHTCQIDPPAVIECGSTVTSTLTDHDCFEPDLGVFFDAWVFEGVAGSTVTIDLTSDEFDTVLALLDAAGNPVDGDDDGGDGTNSRIVYTLDAPGPWAIAASGFGPEELGTYTLSLDCGTPTALYFLEGRFVISVDWRRPNGETGVGQAIPGTDRAGLFYFFNEANLEMLIKMLDGCPLNDRYWVFYAATTNVEFTVTVLDRATGETKEYFNPLGTAAPPVQDTSAFATCP